MRRRGDRQLARGPPAPAAPPTAAAGRRARARACRRAGPGRTRRRRTAAVRPARARRPRRASEPVARAAQRDGRHVGRDEALGAQRLGQQPVAATEVERCRDGPSAATNSTVAAGGAARSSGTSSQSSSSNRLATGVIMPPHAPAVGRGGHLGVRRGAAHPDRVDERAPADGGRARRGRQRLVRRSGGRGRGLDGRVALPPHAGATRATGRRRTSASGWPRPT